MFCVSSLRFCLVDLQSVIAAFPGHGMLHFVASHLGLQFADRVIGIYAYYPISKLKMR